MYRSGVPYKVFFSYGYVLVEDPMEASWLSVREAKLVRDEQRRFHGRSWYILGKEETLVYAVMNT